MIAMSREEVVVVNSFFHIFVTLLPLFAIGFLGAFFRHRRVMDAGADNTILWLVINLFTPCLVLDSMLGKPALENLSILLVAPFIGFLTLIIGIVFAKAGAAYLGCTLKQERTFITLVSIYNWGYISIPVISMLFPTDVLGMLFLFNMGFEFGVWSVSFLILTGSGSVIGTLKGLCRPPFVALVLAVISNAVCAQNPLPQSLMRVIHMMGQATIPLALLFVGAAAFDHGPVIRSISPFRPVLVALLLRLLLIPLTFIALAFFLPLPKELKIVLCVQAAMPSAIFPVIFVQQHHGDLQLAMRIFLSTSLVSLFTMPWWISLACFFS